MVFYAVRTRVLGKEDLTFLGVLVPSIILHEVSHGAVALLFGDHTAQRAGRLTLNPLKHIDPFWTIIVPAMMIFYTGQAFGMAKPVPVNPRNMRSPRNQSLLTSLVGPFTNIIIAIGAAMALRFTYPQTFELVREVRLVAFGSQEASMVATVLVTLGIANVLLAAFNLIPIPPLDGSAVLERLLPNRWLVPYLRIRQYSFFVFVGIFLLAGDILGRIFDPAIQLWFNLLTA